MNIAMVAGHCCIRVYKEANVLKKLGYDLTLVSEIIRYEDHFLGTYKFGNTSELKEIIKWLDSKIDIWHVHNEPTWYVTLIRSVLPKAKIILDYHDSMYWRIRKDVCSERSREPMRWHEEDVAVDCADAFVVPSEECKRELKTRTKKPIIFLPSAVPLSEYRFMPHHFSGGLVSQGGHNTPEEVNGTDKDKNWRNFTDLYKELVPQKMVYVFSPSVTYEKENPFDKYYMSLGVKLGKLPYNKLIEQLGQHTWNLVGNTVDAQVWKYALPNKFFESMAAGIPSVVFNCTEVEKIVKKFDIGISCKTVDELVKRWDENTEKRINLMKIRENFCMENFIHTLTDLYKKMG